MTGGKLSSAELVAAVSIVWCIVWSPKENIILWDHGINMERHLQELYKRVKFEDITGCIAFSPAGTQVLADGTA